MDLFNQTLSLTLCAVTTALIFGAVTLLKKTHSTTSPIRRSIIGIGFAVIFSLGLWFVFSRIFSQDHIPFTFMIWVLPVGFSLYLIATSLKAPRRLIISILAFLAATVLLLLYVNNYYHYYPTLAAVLQRDASARLIGQLTNKEATTNSVVLEQYYQALPGQSALGQLLPLDIPASSSFSPRQGRIYLPPALHHNNQLKLPVIVLLAGYPGSPIHWEQAGILSIMDTFAAAHKGLAPIVAVVDFTGTSDRDTECVDSSQGNAETYLSKDVPDYLKQHYPVQTDPSSWAIGGYSAGGTCGPLIALRHPDVYQNFINVSGDAVPSLGSDAKTVATLFNGSLQQQLDHTPDYLLKKGNQVYSKMSGWYYYGNQDNSAMTLRMKEQYALAKKAGLTVHIQSTDGHHGFLVWKQGYIEGLPWISHQMGLTNL